MKFGLGIAVVCALAPTAASAVDVSWTFAGKTTEASGSVLNFGAVSAGTPFTANFVFDDAMPGAATDTAFENYRVIYGGPTFARDVTAASPLKSASITMNGVTWSTSWDSSLFDVGDNFNGKPGDDWMTASANLGSQQLHFNVQQQPFRQSLDFGEALSVDLASSGYGGGYLYYAPFSLLRLALDHVTVAPSVVVPTTPRADRIELSRLSGAAYHDGNYDNGTRFGFVDGTTLGQGFYGAEYRDGDRIVVSFRGTVPEQLTGLKDVLADSSFATGDPSSALRSYVSKASSFIAQVRETCVTCTIELTGHSLGGAIAGIIADASGYDATTFNAPRIGGLRGDFQSETGILASQTTIPTVVNYRLAGDIVSLIGTPSGITRTVGTSDTADISFSKLVARHRIQTMVDSLDENAIIYEGDLDSDTDLANILGRIIYPTSLDSTTYLFNTVVQSGVHVAFDPDSASSYLFVVGEGSPALSSLELPAFDNLANYRISILSDGTWAEFFDLSPETKLLLPDATTGFQLFAFDTSGTRLNLPRNMLFDAIFATSGLITATLVAAPPTLAAVPESASWAFVISGFALVGAAVRRRAKPALA